MAKMTNAEEILGMAGGTLIGIFYNYKGLKEERYVYDPRTLLAKGGDIAKACEECLERGGSDDWLAANKTYNLVLLDDVQSLEIFTDDESYSSIFADDKSVGNDWYSEYRTDDLFAPKYQADVTNVLSCIDKIMTVSTAHISTATRDWLDAVTDGEESSDLVFYEKEGYGWFIYVPEPGTVKLSEEQEDLRMILNTARNLCCGLVCLDGAAPIVDGLDVYDR